MVVFHVSTFILQLHLAGGCLFHFVQLPKGINAAVRQGYRTGYCRGYPLAIGMASVQFLSQLARIFGDRLRRNEDGQRAVIEKKLRQQIPAGNPQARGMKMG